MRLSRRRDQPQEIAGNAQNGSKGNAGTRLGHGRRIVCDAPTAGTCSNVPDRPAARRARREQNRENLGPAALLRSTGTEQTGLTNEATQTPETNGGQGATAARRATRDAAGRSAPLR